MFEHDEMTEQTNLTEEIDNDTLDDEEEVWEFEDDEAEDDADEAEDEAETEENSEEDAENVAQDEEQEAAEQTDLQEEMFPEELTVYGEKKQVTMSEAKNLIQKGLAYDRAKEKWEIRVQSALNDPRIAFVDELAAAAGMDAVTYIANSRTQTKYAKLLETFGSIEAVPKDILQMFTDNAETVKVKARQELDAAAQAAEDNRLLEEYSEFMVNHPELKEIPREVMELKAKGESLEGAFAITQVKKVLQEKAELEKKYKELENANKVLKQNNKNARSKMPSSQSTAKKDSDLEWDFD